MEDELKNVEFLRNAFTAMGASDPDFLAQQAADEDYPYLAAHCFLHWAWSEIPKPSDRSWIDTELLRAPTIDGGRLIGPALTRLLSSGVDRKDLTDIVRVMQYRVLSRICNILDNVGSTDGLTYPITDFGLFQVNDVDQPLLHIDSLHEMVLHHDFSDDELMPD